MNLFAHILVPVGVALFLWIHVSRLARTYLMPPRALFWGTTALFTLVSVLWPAPMAIKANLLRIPTAVPLDLAYGIWIPVTQMLAAGWVWLLVITLVAVVLAVPWIMRPKEEKAPPPSYVDPKFCTGCEQCYYDCPYEAISMVRRDEGDTRSEFVGLVDPDKCVSCGICSGSCAPMGVGPPERSGRDQLAQVKAFISEVQPGPDDIVIIGCSNGAAGRQQEIAGARVYHISCVGSLHTSVIEYLVRAGTGGVMVASCPPRDCWNREGVTWLEERIYNEREAELKDRVDRRRVRIVFAGEAERPTIEAEVALFRSQMKALDEALSEQEIEIDVECVVPEVSVAQEVGA
jgi:ferredoxin